MDNSFRDFKGKKDLLLHENIFKNLNGTVYPNKSVFGKSIPLLSFLNKFNSKNSGSHIHLKYSKNKASLRFTKITHLSHIWKAEENHYVAQLALTLTFQSHLSRF